MSFKLLAIRPLEGCNGKFLKNLEENRIYQFYNDYEFQDKSGNKIEDFAKLIDVQKIKYTPTVPENLYYQKRVKQDDIAINISAIVGKNGSGKSCLVEFLLYQLFIISNNPKYINPDLFLDNKLDEYLYKVKVDEINIGIIGEFYYLIDNKISLIRIKNNIISKIDFILDSDKITFIKSTEILDNVKDIKQVLPFFFSIIINFSFYSFNTDIIGLWIKAFFHKNDGYQLPVVISPYRDEGNMDINIELFLTTARLMTNLLNLDGYDYINNKKIEKIFLQLSKKKDFSSIEDEYIREKRKAIFKPLFNAMFNNEFEYPNVEIGDDNDSYIKKFAEKYLDNKLRNIPQRYQSFNKYKDMSSSDENYAEKCLDYVKDLVKDRSHITLKVRQTINFLREDIFSYTDDDVANIIIDPSKIRNKIDSFRDQKWFTETIDYIPPPFLVPFILFEDKSYFSDLSSGEQQKAFSINSIIYHLKNIDSVFDSLNVDQINYENINLILDEIELYYHPEFQKSFINDLLNNIKAAKFEHINKINILFLTHSPFILSDIPKQNILYLKNKETEINGKKVYLAITQDYKTKSSFGANIHDLLADSFFIGDGLIGNFAKSKIEETINWINSQKILIENSKTSKLHKVDKNDFDYHKKVIGLIDEKIIRMKLAEMLDELVNGSEFEKELALEEIEFLKSKFNL